MHHSKLHKYFVYKKKRTLVKCIFCRVFSSSNVFLLLFYFKLIIGREFQESKITSNKILVCIFFLSIWVLLYLMHVSKYKHYTYTHQTNKYNSKQYDTNNKKNTNTHRLQMFYYVCSFHYKLPSTSAERKSGPLYLTIMC